MSLETPVGGNDDSTELGDFLPDESILEPGDAASNCPGLAIDLAAHWLNLGYCKPRNMPVQPVDGFAALPVTYLFTLPPVP